MWAAVWPAVGHNEPEGIYSFFALFFSLLSLSLPSTRQIMIMGMTQIHPTTSVRPSPWHTGAITAPVIKADTVSFILTERLLLWMMTLNVCVCVCVGGQNWPWGSANIGECSHWQPSVSVSFISGPMQRDRAGPAAVIVHHVRLMGRDVSSI